MNPILIILLSVFAFAFLAAKHVLPIQPILVSDFYISPTIIAFSHIQNHKLNP